MRTGSRYVLSVWDANPTGTSHTEDQPSCSIRIEVEDADAESGTTLPDDPPPEDFWGIDPLIDAPLEPPDPPLLLTIGRPFVRGLFGAAIRAGYTCRIDLGPTIERPFDPPTMCRTIRELDSWLESVTADIGSETHDDVYPIHVWALPAGQEDETSDLVLKFWQDPDGDDAYRAIIDGGVVRASLAQTSCGLTQRCDLRGTTMDWVRHASDGAGLPVHWQ